MELIAILVAYLFGTLVGYVLSKQEIKIKITKHHITDQPEVTPLGDKEAEQLIQEQDILQSAQSYLDTYLREVE